MTTSTFCNRCGIIKKEEKGWLRIEAIINEKKFIVDLCSDCSKEFTFGWGIKDE